MSVFVKGAADFQIGQDSNSGFLNRPKWPKGPGYQYAFTGGHGIGTQTGEMIFNCRWAHPTKICVFKRIRLHVIEGANVGTAQTLGYDVTVGRNYLTEQFIGNIIRLSQNRTKKKTSYPSSQMRLITNATTNGTTIGAGVTLDSNSLGRAHGRILAIGGDTPFDLELDLDWRQIIPHAVILRQHEGIFIRVFPSAANAPIMKHTVMLEWLEVDSLD